MKRLLLLTISLSLYPMDRDSSQHHSIKREPDPRTPVESYNLTYADKTKQEAERERQRENRHKKTNDIIYNKLMDRINSR